MFETTVLIVGGGPVGLLGAQLLGRRGVATVLAEKYAARLDAPKAHAVNPRSLEICAAAGLPMDAIHAAATPTADGRHVRIVETLAGPQIGALDYERQDDAVRALAPWPLINIAQPAFEAVVEAAARTQRAVSLRRGLEWRSCLQLGDGVVSTLVDRATGEALKVRSRYLIAADGAGSSVRDAVGIAMDGPEALASNMMIHFEADLRGVVGDRPGILYFLLGPGVNGVMIAYDIGRTWVFMLPCRPDERPEDFGEDRCREAVLAAIGAAVPALKIKGVRSWQMSAQVARRYVDGRVYLAGDAGHRFPPTGGLGLNTGIGDIDNLAWKIAAVEKGWASPALLETYESERRIIAQSNMGQSLVNALRIRALYDALGYGPDQKVDADVFAARLADPDARAQVDAAIAFQKDHFDSLRLQLGFAYGDALKADDQLPVSQFTPKAAPGARLPHAALADGRSSLDLIDTDAMTLIIGAGGKTWRGFAAGAAAPITMRLEGCDFDGLAGSFIEGLGLAASGALLVRPDGHILALAPTGEASQSDRLADALGSYLVGAMARAA